jgi:hAT family C-terminal dimerisation region
MSENDTGNCQQLTSEDWKILKKLHGMLESFYNATLCTEGNKDHLGRWLPAMEFIHSIVSNFVSEAKDLKVKEPGNQKYPWLEAAAEGALEKCKKYYKLADDSPAYYAAEILQPHRKWNWLHQRWSDNDKTEPWLTTAKKAVQELWEEEYKGKYRTVQLSTRPRQKAHSRPDFSDISQFMVLEKIETPTGDSYQNYIERDPEVRLSNEEVLDYWNSRLLSQPDMAHFALDMLALPASSAECERVFSSAKLLITSARNRLNPDIVEINECLKCWFAKEEEGQEPQESKGSTAEECNREANWGGKDIAGEGSEDTCDETGDESSSNQDSSELEESDEEDVLE